jgi:flagellar hook-basal body complex protein FliE
MSAAVAGIEAVGAAPSLEPLARIGGAPATVQGGGFGDMLADGLSDLNRTLLSSQADMQALAAGEVGSLHQVMINMEETRLQFQLMMQVRNRLLEAYQDVMKMQV